MSTQKTLTYNIKTAHLDIEDISDAEFEVLDGVVAGTAAANKAVVLNGSKGISTITSATITTLTAPTVNATNVDAGASGTAGTVDVFPATAAKGKLQIAPANNTGDTTTTITNAAMAAARTLTIPDPGAAASFVMSEGASTINGVKTFGSAPVASGASLTANTIPRASLATDALRKSLAILPKDWQHATTGAPLVVAETAGTHNLAQYYIIGEVTDNETEVSVSQAYFQLPGEYVSGGALSITFEAARLGGEDAGAASRIDCTVEKMTTGAPGGNAVTTAEQVLTATPTVFTFSVDPTGFVAGDLMRLKLTTTIVDDVGGTTATALVAETKILCDVKG